MYLSNLLNDTGNTFEISRDKQLARINSKPRDVYGPLTKVLQQVDEFKQSEDTEMEFDPMAFSLALEQSVVLLGQAQGAINFQRRRSILGAITKRDSKAKTMIKDEFVEELEKSGELLFGKDFEKKMTRKFKHDHKSIARGLAPSMHRNRKEPFRKTPHTGTSQGVGQKVGRFVRPDKDNTTFPYKYSFVKHASNRTKSKRSCSPHNSNTISSDKKQTHSHRKTKTFQIPMVENHIKSGNTFHNFGVGDTFL